MKNSIKCGILLLLLAICSSLSLSLVGMHIVENKEKKVEFIDTNAITIENNYSKAYRSVVKFFNTYYKLYDVCFPITDRLICGRSNLPNEGKRYKNQKHDGYTEGFPLNFSTIIEPIQQCEGSNSIIIGISGAPFNYLRRIVYREIYKGYKIYFFTAKSRNETTNLLLKEENEIYDDIIQFEFYASYFNLTSQTIHEMRWVNSHCDKYIYYMHQSDDTFYNVKLFRSKFVDNSRKSIHDFIGFRWIGNVAIHRINSIYYIPTDIWPGPTYPPQPSGPGYILSKNIMPVIANATYYMDKTILFEDAYMGILLDYVKINITPINKLVNPFFGDRNTEGKEYAKTKIYIHSLNPFELYLLSKIV